MMNFLLGTEHLSAVHGTFAYDVPAPNDKHTALVLAATPQRH